MHFFVKFIITNMVIAITNIYQNQYFDFNPVIIIVHHIIIIN